jgi:hypothetical protein
MTYDTLADILFVSLTAAAVAGFAVSAHAGAPGPDLGESVLVQPSAMPAYAELSPAEIRNAASVRADTLAAQGIIVDRTELYGVGLPAERIADAN